MTSLNKIILEAAFRITKEIGAKALLLYADMAVDLPGEEDPKRDFELVLVKRSAARSEDQQVHAGITLEVPDVNLTRVGQVKIAVTKGIATGLFKRGDKIVCLSGIPKFGYADSIFVIDVGKEFEILTLEDITDVMEGLQPEVFGEVLNITLELASQGREGRKVGAIFVLGDHEMVLQLSRQMIINPFMGYSEEERNILNPELTKTIKEFSALDGAFIVKDNGAIVTAGRHLSAALESKDFPKGLGSRHIAAAGITSITHAIAVVLSESSGAVSVFKKGKMLVSIEKPLE